MSREEALGTDTNLKICIEFLRSLRGKVSFRQRSLNACMHVITAIKLEQPRVALEMLGTMR